MEIIRTSLFTKKQHTREINVTPEQMYAWQNGKHIQDAMPNVSAEDREYILTGVTPEEWNEVFGKEEQ